MTRAAEGSDWRRRATMLATELTDTGVLTDPSWRAAIEQTPPRLFVPRFYRNDDTIADGADPVTVGEWLDAVYSDTSLVVQCAIAPGTDIPFPTSSSTMPSLMVRMLQLLDIIDGSRVLEIGTATGYNAALLCHRLGAEHVASIELHPGLAADAADRLHGLGYAPTLAVGDGAGGIPDRAPYDRIIATCAVPAIPAAWIDQLAPGGRIVTDLRGELASSLAVLDKSGPDTVQGRLLDLPGHFMWLRSTPESPLPNADRFNFVINLDDAETLGTDLDPRMLNEPGLRVLLSIVEPTLGPSRIPSVRPTTSGGYARTTAGLRSPPVPPPPSPTADPTTSGEPSNASPPNGSASAAPGVAATASLPALTAPITTGSTNPTSSSSPTSGPPASRRTQHSRSATTSQTNMSFLSTLEYPGW
jgi:protein-L-isoaspartate O-methyltransferase